MNVFEIPENPRPMNQSQDELDPPFEIIEPEQARGPVLFNSPHSGRVYPRAFLQSSRLDLPTLRRSEDSFVDDLTLGVVARGYPLMRAHFPRCFFDDNHITIDGTTSISFTERSRQAVRRTRLARAVGRGCERPGRASQRDQERTG